MENSVATDYEKIFIEKPIVHDVEALKDGLERLDKVKNTLDKKEITDILKDMVQAPSPVDLEQLLELNISLLRK